MRRLVITVAICALSGLAPQVGSAHAVANVDDSGFAITVTPAYPDAFASVDISYDVTSSSVDLVGKATGGGGCRGDGSRRYVGCDINGHASADNGAFARAYVELDMAVRFTNVSDHTVAGFGAVSTFSAFLPFNGPIGASVDDPSLEYARFQSFALFNAQACDTRSASDLAVFGSTRACGVMSPDSSQETLGVGSLAPGESSTLDGKVELVVEVGSVPTPPASALAGVVALAAIVRRRRDGASAAR